MQAKPSLPRSDVSSTGNSLAKPESLPTGLQKKTIVSDDKLHVTVDSTDRITINKAIFGTASKDSNCALARQVLSIAPTAAGNDNLLNFRFALATMHGIGCERRT